MLKKGSIFKFVYQLDHETKSWFTISSNSSKELKIIFIKNSVWVHSDFMADNKIYYTSDFFNTDNYVHKTDRNFGNKLMKLIYQNFESFALYGENNQIFYSFEPSERVYDLFLINKNVKSSNNTNDPNNAYMNFMNKNRLSVSRIMAVIL